MECPLLCNHIFSAPWTAPVWRRGSPMHANLASFGEVVGAGEGGRTAFGRPSKYSSACALSPAFPSLAQKCLQKYSSVNTGETQRVLGSPLAVPRDNALFCQTPLMFSNVYFPSTPRSFPTFTFLSSPLDAAVWCCGLISPPESDMKRLQWRTWW